MPRKAKHPCHHPGCPNLTEGRFCEEHQKEENKRYEKYGRDPATRKRYGRAWKRIRDSYVKTHPFCELCYEKECLSRSKRYTTRFLCQKVEHMTGTTSSLCASHATQGYTQREVTDGMEERVIHTNDGRASHI